MGGAELQGGGFEVGVVAGADGRDGLGAGGDLGRGGFVVEGGAAGEQAGVVGAAEHDLGALGGAGGEEFGQRGVVEQGVAAGDQEDVGIGLFEGGECGLDEVDAEAPGLDFAALAHRREDFAGAGHGFAEAGGPGGSVPVLGAVVDVDDIDAGEAHAGAAIFQGADCGAGGIVEGAGEGERAQEALVELGDGGDGAKEAADFGGEAEIGAVLLAQDGAHAHFGEAGAIMRRGVEVADAGVPARLGGGGRVGFVDAGEEVAEGRAAHAQRTRNEGAGAGHAGSPGILTSGAMTPLVRAMLP